MCLRFLQRASERLSGAVATTEAPRLREHARGSGNRGSAVAYDTTRREDVQSIYTGRTVDCG